MFQPDHRPMVTALATRKRRLIPGPVPKGECSCRCQSSMDLRLRWSPQDARLSDSAELVGASKTLEARLLSQLLSDPVRREELWTWLVKDAGQLPVATADKGTACQVALDLLPSPRRSSKKSRPACNRLLLGLCKARADKAALFLWRHSPQSYAVLFETDKNSCIQQWFDHFGSAGNTNFSFGAKALTSYAIAHREEVWDLLVWSDGQSRSPVAVVAKMHYFARLDVTQTVRNFAAECPRFWSSEEFRDTLEGSSILALDSAFFVQALWSTLEDGRRGSSELLALVEDYVRAASWQELMQPLLPLLPEEALLRCCTHALPVNTFDGPGLGLGRGSEAALQAMVYGVASFGSMDELMLYSALALRRRQLLRLQAADEWSEVLQGVSEDMDKVLQASQQTHWAAMLLDSSLSRTRRMKRLIMLLFCEHWSIMTGSQKDREAVHSVCESNGIALCQQVTTNENAEMDEKRYKKRKAKHSKKDKKRRKHNRRKSSDSDMSRNLIDQSDTDDFVTTSPDAQDAGGLWDVVFGPYRVVSAFRDIPEHILSICACIRFGAYVKAHG